MHPMVESAAVPVAQAGCGAIITINEANRIDDESAFGSAVINHAFLPFSFRLSLSILPSLLYVVTREFATFFVRRSAL